MNTNYNINNCLEEYKRLIKLQDISNEDKIKELEAANFINNVFKKYEGVDRFSEKDVLNIIKTTIECYPKKTQRESDFCRLVNKELQWLFWKLKQDKRCHNEKS